MSWHPDTPDLPINKPEFIESLEQMDRHVLDSMPPAEVSEMVVDTIRATAKAYLDKTPNGNLEECAEFVSIALSVTGSAIGGKVGFAMIAASGNDAAKEACKDFFSEY